MLGRFLQKEILTEMEFIMEHKKIYLASPTMHGDEQRFVKEAFDTNWIAPLGKNVNEFENEIKKYIGIKDAAALSAGTAAIHLAIRMLGINSGDIVFCSDLTFAATVNPVSYENATQVFIDSERESWNMDPRALRRAFEKYPEAKAVIVVNLYGTPAKLDEIREICNEHNVPLIEDAAESLGASYKEQMTGTFGRCGILSFNGNKIITTSGGGMLISDDNKLTCKARFLATQARENERYYQHKEIGFNYRMSNVVAGIGRGQLMHISEHIMAKRKIYETYREGFRDIASIKMNPYLSYSNPNFWLSCMTIEPKSGVKPLDIMMELEKYNIETRPIWKPMHMQPIFERRDYIYCEDKPVSEEIFNNGLCLPSDIKNTDEDMEEIISIIRGMFNV